MRMTMPVRDQQLERQGRRMGHSAARFLTIIYFLYFLLMPWYTARDKTKPVPERVTG